MKLFLCLVGALLVAGVAADMKHPPSLRKLQESTAVTDPSTEVTVPEEPEIPPEDSEGGGDEDDDDLEEGDDAFTPKEGDGEERRALGTWCG
ncbi:unnamed protein product, partial [Vitrella brassicaformis CCMP3155]